LGVAIKEEKGFNQTSPDKEQSKRLAKAKLKAVKHAKRTRRKLLAR